MIDYFDPLCPADRNLLLAGPSCDNVEADWKAFNGTLSGAAAAFAYFHLLPHRQIMIRTLTEGTPGYETLAVRLAYPLFAWFLRKVLGLAASVAEEAHGQIRTAVQNVDARLAGPPVPRGRPFLAVGHGFCERLGAPGASRCIREIAALLCRNAARPAVRYRGDSIAPCWPIRAPHLS
ncbi:MAG: hypothetical protein WA624_05955 [Methylocella sp.]